MSENTPEVSSVETSQKVGFLSDSLYDRLKFLALVVLPALGAAYYGLAAIWGLPRADDVVGTIVVIDTFLGVLLGISTSKYNANEDRFDGAIDLEPDHENGLTNMNVSMDPAAIENKDQVVLKVRGK